jgi:uncharacterized protein (UPF0264 family)
MAARLLVSVRSAVEARIAVDAGVDLIDIKEPNRGSLGAADIRTIAEIVTAVNGEAPLSAALGELRDVDMARLCDLQGICYAKFGLSGMADEPDWQKLFAAAVNALPSDVSAVAVIYADHARAKAPASEDIFVAATRNQCAAVLIDTFIKDGATLLDYFSLDDLRSVADAVHARGMLLVAAGSLTISSAQPVAQCGADYVAVRGAVCKSSRASELDAALVRSFAQTVRACSQCAATA